MTTNGHQLALDEFRTKAALPNVSRRILAEIEHGLVPALQERGLTRAAYTRAQFRDNLLEF